MLFSPINVLGVDQSEDGSRALRFLRGIVKVKYLYAQHIHYD